VKLSDYLADFLSRQGITHVFLVSGGAIIHSVDSAAKHPSLRVVCAQHEQGAGAAADGYARIARRPGAVMVTSGPGGTNLTTSVANAFFDSIPVIFICGQVATFRIRKSARLRQKGFQETDVVSVFKSITKYVAQIQKPEDIRYELEKATFLAQDGRPGPVLLDIPDDIQRADIIPADLKAFVPPSKEVLDLHAPVDGFLSLLKESRRPVVIMGAGVSITRTAGPALRFFENFGLPVLLTWGGKDLVPADHPLNMGGLGVCGPRAGNFAVQNADLVMALGTRLSQMITGGKPALFAPGAKKVMVDIDREELAKFTKDEFSLDLGIEADLRDFFEALEDARPEPGSGDPFARWREQIKTWGRTYPVCTPERYQRKDKVDGVVFINELSAELPEGVTVVADTGANLAWTMQTFRVKPRQRIISAWNHTPMGYALPASVGAACASGQEVVCVTGDGGIMMSLEELGTVRRYDLPVKIFIMFNQGHGIQRQTIDTWLDSRYTAVDEPSGLYFPDFRSIAAGFGLPYVNIKNHTDVQPALEEVLKMPGPVLCVVEILKDQKIVPMLKFGAGLEDLDPKLPADELQQIMRVSDDISCRTGL
jgi:acetolactate synthase-1/2/3 large subunit